MVFSVNTIAGFACSIGVDMGYNTKHHEKTSSHSHEKENNHDAVHKHTNSATYSGQSISESKADDCCTTGVTDFIKLDKSVVNNHLLFQALVFLTAFASALILPDLYRANLIDDAKLQTVRRSWRLAYHTDLRIVIQSFQI